MSGTNPAVEEAFDRPSKPLATKDDGNKNVEDAFDRPSKPLATENNGNPNVEKAFDQGSKPAASGKKSAADEAFDNPSKPSSGGSESHADKAFDSETNKSGLSAAQEEGNKSKFEKMVDPMKKAVGGDSEAGESKTSSKIMDKLKESSSSLVEEFKPKL